MLVPGRNLSYLILRPLSLPIKDEESKKQDLSDGIWLMAELGIRSLVPPLTPFSFQEHGYEVEGMRNKYGKQQVHRFT